MLPPNTDSEPAFLKPHMPFKLASKVRTLVQNGKRIGFLMSLESLKINVCCLSENNIRDPREVL